LACPQLVQGAGLPGGQRSFDQPWELRALALIVAAHEAGRCSWSDFQGELIAAIARWEADPCVQNVPGHHSYVSGADHRHRRVGGVPPREPEAGSSEGAESSDLKSNERRP
jgi:hypothetical protein